MPLALAIGFGSGLFACLAVAAGWSMSRTFAVPAAVLLTTEQVAAQCEASVAFVSGPDGSGTGFLVEDGLLATNAHVIDSTLPDQIRITFPAAPELDRGPILGRVVYFDPARDLAILRVSTRLPPLKTVSNHRFRRGQDVVVIGNPGIGGRSLECVVSRGVLGSQVEEDGQPFYQLSGSINPGNSGGPALDLLGQVVGVVTLKASKQEGLGFCIPSTDLARAIGKAASQPEPEARRAADRHLMAAKDAAREARLVAILGRTDPATWIAMLDLDRESGDNSPEAIRMRDWLDQADELYQEERSAIVSMIFQVHSSAKKSGHPVLAAEILAGSLDWAPRRFFLSGEPIKFENYARLYARFLEQGGTHGRAVASLRDFYQRLQREAVTSLEATERAPTQTPHRVTGKTPEPVPTLVPPPSRPTGSADTIIPSPLSEALRLGKSLEYQGKIRRALRSYYDLVDDHPGTPEAQEAARRIAVLARPPSFGNIPPAKVLDVLDGRTILVDLNGSRTAVRLFGLDPLPAKRSASPQGSWEAQTREFLKRLIEGRSLHLDYERGMSQLDGEGHVLAYLYRADDKLSVNREMIARGYGIGSRTGTFSQAEDFRDADARARSRKVGLWQP